ncbi:putative dolichyl-diphosphooligosaccharide--protein glycosyltransferase subunit STT3B [Monocercomonoides exilis]|uniref:putative dolichyl-diphosphooligosaccharide--protein glycosyltransferase subunit STT3B n=1 Tax=Monocercomonoides exilis TaxID=2049356 RepID=UPI00355A0B2D|nr:putative dolichyl-diphosphooligosaccharide--protein glycosyltransferase subunit STT3B [Monocercomonoides exilis]|eukprot:MONOS_5692.1-p1 / transcript=MONOS_5692.1 / gene=MONOS_5692 / organism=Monocercomonoides_exilis_PA203 / gene_product=GG17558 / transcript_product=GG17558 / location=Mono_scaffold00169:13475-15908(-) / protein_length=772 / sequence_SO=supercontig / SO=protein_coding / is_pseudo=false
METQASVTNYISRRIEVLVLIVASILAFLPRLLSVLRYEAVIHEFDPYFNYRSSQYLVDEGIYKFHNWFDERAWYPLGRIVGGTVYPGLMWSAALVYKFMEWIGFPVDVRISCILVSPIWASMTVLVTYALTKAVWNRHAALIAAMLVSIVPGYMSRSVSGSFDNECISIFALLWVFYYWIRSVQTGSMWMALLCAGAYFYMASAWGGYVFIINLIPLYVLVMLIFGRYSRRLHIAYTSFYVMGILSSMQIQFVSFMPVQSGEHLASFGIFGLMTLIAFLLFLYRSMSREDFMKTLKVGASILGGVAFVAMIGLYYTGYITPWTGRFYNLLHPTYAKSHIPIIASVSEHQPTAWPHFFFDLHLNSLLFIAGIYFIFKKVKEEKSVATAEHDHDAAEVEARKEQAAKNDGLMFVAVYSCASLYFSGVMVRLMLVLAPAACIVGAIAISEILSVIARRAMRFANGSRVGLKNSTDTATINSTITKNEANSVTKSINSTESSSASRSSSDSNRLPIRRTTSKPKSLISLQTVLPFVSLGIVSVFLMIYGLHCIWVTSNAYSSPSIVFAWYTNDGTRVMIDDFREAYSWLRHNTDVNAKVMSWWDYGYQITAVANRTVIVDNNTWNNSHIATVGTAMSSTEEDAWPILQYLDVDYILVLFGGMSGYSGDDVNKFLWMVRIGGGVFPRIVEADYLSKRGEYRVDSEAGPAFLNCILYKMCYYNFGQITTRADKPAGFDLARNQVIGNKDISFEHLEEAYTTQRWIVRIFKVKKEETF